MPLAVLVALVVVAVAAVVLVVVALVVVAVLDASFFTTNDNYLRGLMCHLTDTSLPTF
jgi:hypothetical protein